MLLFVREAFNAKKIIILSLMYAHLETIIVSFSVGKIYYVIGNVYRPPNSNNDDFLSNVPNILFTALNDFPNSVFYIMAEFDCDLFSISSNNRYMVF